MTLHAIACLRTLVQPEEVAWRSPDRPTDWQPRGFSLKAVFWWAASIALALALGNLT